MAELRTQLAGDLPDVVITETEINQVILDNLADDVIGVEEDLKKLANLQNPRLFPIDIHVFSIAPFKGIMVVGEYGI